MPKNDDKIIWTRHALSKMRQYGLSEIRLRRLIRRYRRREPGIAPGTVAIMQPSGSRGHPTEIWLMYQLNPSDKKIKIITTWRYPGVSKKNKGLPVPAEIIEELKEISV